MIPCYPEVGAPLSARCCVQNRGKRFGGSMPNVRSAPVGVLEQKPKPWHRLLPQRLLLKSVWIKGFCPQTKYLNSVLARQAQNGSRPWPCANISNSFHINFKRISSPPLTYTSCRFSCNSSHKRNSHGQSGTRQRSKWHVSEVKIALSRGQSTTGQRSK